MTDHLAKAREYIGRGEEFYRKAADEIVAAMAEDSTLGFGRVAEVIGRSETWCRDIVRWRTNPQGPETPFADPSGERHKRATKQILRESTPDEIAATVLNDPVIRDNIGRALDRHYSAKTEASKQRARKTEVEEHGGEDEHAAFQRRQRIAEVVNVARGLTTGMRFVVEEVRRLNLDEFEEAGSRDELADCASEVEGFAVLLRQFLSGAEITDADIADFIGEAA